MQRYRSNGCNNSCCPPAPHLHQHVDVLPVKPSQLLGALHRKPQVLLLLLGLRRLLIILRSLDWGGGGAPACHPKHPRGGRALLHRLLHLLLQLFPLHLPLLALSLHKREEDKEDKLKD